MSGPPPEGHPRQCRARSQQTRQRCRRWALLNRGYCQFHGGRRAAATWRGMGRYSRHLGETLRKLVEGFASEPHHEQVALYEELALARSTVVDAVKLFDAASQGGSLKTKALAASVMRDALAFVRDMCLAASRVEKDAEDKVSVNVLQLFVVQIVRAVHRVVPDEATARKLEEEIRSSVRLPAVRGAAVEVEGSELTPDAVLLEMHEATGGER